MNMNIEIDNETYEIVVVKKRNKNTYIRVKDDKKIYVTTNYLVTQNYIYNLVKDNIDSIRKMLKRVNTTINNQDTFFYLGKRYDIIIVPVIKKIKINEDTIIAPSRKYFENWLKNEALNVFSKRYDIVFNNFNENVYKPTLKVRTMKTRWGVYNRKNHTITLNTKLLSYSDVEIDYVIIHELSHLIYFDHSKKFWQLVEKYCSNYKEVRKKLNE